MQVDSNARAAREREQFTQTRELRGGRSSHQSHLRPPCKRSVESKSQRFWEYQIEPRHGKFIAEIRPQ